MTSPLLSRILSTLNILVLEWHAGETQPTGETQPAEKTLTAVGILPEWASREFSCFQADNTSDTDTKKIKAVEDDTLETETAETTETRTTNDAISAEAFSPFLENFLIDAQAFWQEQSAEMLRSGIWTETGLTGQDIFLEAIALYLDGHPLLLIEATDIDNGSEKFRWLQTARQEQLDFMSERKLAANKLIHATFYDRLTGLPNRSLFLSQIETIFEQYKWNPQRPFALVVLNLDRFQQLNSSLGSVAGDQVLVAIANRIQHCLRKHDVPVRFGADEFGILLTSIGTAAEAATIVQRILTGLQRPILVDGNKTYLTATAGIALSETWYKSSRDLLRDASLAMHQAKTLGRGRYTVFNRDMRARAFELWNLESELHSAIARQELQLVFQPIVNAKSNRIESFEALIRWHHPEQGWISPAKFIPLAEETGLIVAIDTWVLNTACQAIQQWRNQKGDNIQVNVNISARHFAEETLFATVREAIATWKIPSSCLRLEITESSLLGNTTIAIRTLTHLKALGIQIAIDDFGTGYASLSYLQDLPLDLLKIDGYFIEMMEANGSDIVQTIIELAHKLGFGVTAERVETLSQFNTLKQLGCDTVQGYLFSRPIPSTDAQALLGTEVIVSR
ncbi:MAG: EAL domain-containing protein [Cyanobacteria bacterium J06627_28]